MRAWYEMARCARRLHRKVAKALLLSLGLEAWGLAGQCGQGGRKPNPARCLHKSDALICF